MKFGSSGHHYKPPPWEELQPAAPSVVVQTQVWVFLALQCWGRRWLGQPWEGGLSADSSWPLERLLRRHELWWPLVFSATQESWPRRGLPDQQECGNRFAGGKPHLRGRGGKVPAKTSEASVDSEMPVLGWTAFRCQGTPSLCTV